MFQGIRNVPSKQDNVDFILDPTEATTQSN